MNCQELAHKAHENAVKHGFWAERKSNEHCLMLIVTEVSELVEADRKDIRAKMKDFQKDLECYNTFHKTHHVQEPTDLFEKYIKNTLEDEFADIAIRLADLAGALGVVFDKMQPCRYFRAYDKFSFTENAFALCKGLSKDNIGIEKRIQFGLDFVRNWTYELGIDLNKHIQLKMSYNETRELLHGKKY